MARASGFGSSRGHERCPCSSGMRYENCCEPLHREQQRAATAEQLMRSRYSAFALAEVDYLIATHPDASMSPVQRRKELRNYCRETCWLGLKIKALDAGDVDDMEGTVTFEATFCAGGRRQVMTETSFFRRRDGDREGNWLYIRPL